MRGSLACLVGAALVLSGCGETTDTTRSVAAVPERVAPETIQDGTLGVVRSPSEGPREALQSVRGKALVSGVTLWEIRRLDRSAELVGALQVSSVKPSVDLDDASQQRAILRGVLTDRPQVIRVEEVEVQVSRASKKATYLWFWRRQGLFSVLQLKTQRVDGEAILSEIIAFQRRRL